MEFTDLTSNGRPLSLPSPSTSPTSPVANCCICAKLSKSSNSVFHKKEESVLCRSKPDFSKNHTSQHLKLPKFSWSVHKCKEKPVPKPRHLFTVSSDSALALNQNRFSNSQPTSWAFFNSKEPKKVSVKGDDVEISPVYQSQYDVEMEKRLNVKKIDKLQVFTMTPTTTRASKRVTENTKIAHSSTEPNNLRELVLSKSISPQNKNEALMKSDIPRSPGPLDGSPYAQVKKKKRTGKEPSTISLCKKRGYHSADELSCAAKPLRKPQVDSVIKETKSVQEVNSSSNDGYIQVKTTTSGVKFSDFRSVDLLRDLNKAPPPPEFPSPTESGYHTIMATDVGVNCQTVVITTERNRKTSQEDSASTSSYESEVPIAVSIIPPNENSQHLPGNKISTTLSSTTCNDSVQDTARPRHGLSLNLNKDAGVEPSMSQSSVISSSMSSSLSDMSPSTKSQLTKEQVHEAVALINECLSDQELRSGSISSSDVQLSLQQQLSNRSTADFDTPSEAEARFSSDEPQFSPAQPDYTLQDIEQHFGDKSPEYALPVRDVVKGTVPARTAVLVTQNKGYVSSNPDAKLDVALADLVHKSSPTSTDKPFPSRQKMQTINHNSHVGSSHSMISPSSVTAQALRKTTSSSDVDSRIDGGALSVPIASNTKASPIVDKNAITITTTVSVSSGFAPSNSSSNKVNDVGEPSKYDTSQEPISSANANPLDEDEEEEERRMREEIENTQKRLLWLQEQRKLLKMQKEEKIKRHSFGYTTPNLPAKTKVGNSTGGAVSATLPRPPGHSVKHDSIGNHNKADQGQIRQPSAQEQVDMAELLRSVQQPDVPSSLNTNKVNSNFSGSAMISSAMNVESGNQYPHFQSTSPGFKVADPNVVKRADVFTPAYAHPMHQPQHMGSHHYQIQQQRQDNEAKKREQDALRLKEEARKRKEEEEKKKREGELAQKKKAELRRLYELDQQQMRIEREKKQREVDEREKRRQAERIQQEKFQVEFEQRQKQLQQEKRRMLQQSSVAVSSDRQPQINHKHQTQVEKAIPTSNTTLPSPKKTKASTLTAQVKSDELQTQLDELDMYIAHLSQNFDSPADGSLVASPSKKDVGKRRPYSIEVDSKWNANPLPTEDITSFVGKKATPPRPPSRTRSSFDSVSRRLSHGFELAQAMRQNSIDQDSQAAIKDDDVFSPQAAPQPSYPPQTRHTRPAQQQIIASPAPAVSPSPHPAPQKTGSMEDKLSPQLFLAMAVNPGGRPVEEIHSYKEDLDPTPSTDTVDSAPVPATPGFPTSPTTPYVNATSPLSGHPHTPVGMAKTPLSALGLKPSPNPEPAIQPIPSTESKGRSQISTATAQKPTHFNGTSKTAAQIRLEDQTKSNFYKDDEPNNNATENIRGRFQPGAKRALNSHSLDSGYADSHQPNLSPNGWVQHSPLNTESSQIRTANGVQPSEKDLKSPWIHSGSSSPQVSTPSGKSPGPAFSYSASGGDSPSASRSLAGSNDSLLSDGSSTNHPHLAYQQQRFNGSHPSLPPKESSVRNSGSSIRSTSTGSGYLGGTSQTSPHSSGSPVSSTTGHYPFSQPVNRRESQLSAYDRQGSHSHHPLHLSSDDGALSSPTSGRTSSSSISDIEKLAHEVSQSSLSGGAPKFIKDTTSYWYKPDITREQALAMLRLRSAGSFVVRDSRCYPGAFGLALKVHQVPQAVLATAKPGTDMNNELVRHFLIEPSTRGVKLKGCANEPVFGSLSALIYQHSITQLALPCKLIIPTENQEVPATTGTGRNSSEVSNSATELLRQGAACNVLYLGSAETESLTGPEAVERGMRECIQNKNRKTSVVHFKVSPQGITLTDNARKIFFRRHYPTTTVTYCGMDPSAREPHNRRWDASKDRGPPNARVFGFVAKKPGSAVDNVCHLFAELDLDQPAPAIVNFVSKVLIGST